MNIEQTFDGILQGIGESFATLLPSLPPVAKWRLVDEGEIVPDTFEYWQWGKGPWLNGKDHASYHIGTPYEGRAPGSTKGCHAFRVPVEDWAAQGRPYMEGWRLLGPDEVIMEGDELQALSVWKRGEQGGWIKPGHAFDVGQTYNKGRAAGAGEVVIRRKIREVAS